MVEADVIAPPLPAAPEVHFTIRLAPNLAIRPGDVLLLKVQRELSVKAKQELVQWFRGAIEGTSLAGCKVILLDGGMDVEIYRGDEVT